MSLDKITLKVNGKLRRLPRGAVMRTLWARIGLLTMSCLSSACTVIHVAGADKVETRVLPGIAVVTLEAGPGAVLVVKRVGYGLAINQGQLMLGYEASDQVFASEGVDCLAVLLPPAGLDAHQIHRERERILNACKKP